MGPARQRDPAIPRGKQIPDMKTLNRALALTTLACASAFGMRTPVPTSPAAQERGDDTQARLAVLVTGASSGIGRRTAEYLAENGFYVYAGARKQRDIDELSALESVEGVRLDVTVQADIDAAVETVRAGGRGLYGLINNAGVAVVGPLIELSEQDMHFQMDVNVFGPFRVTKAFAPLLIESQGRVSTTGSISGTLTWGMGGAYSMSKHAMEAYSDTLAIELGLLGVKVSIVEPGNYKSDIMASRVERLAERGYTTEGSRYKDYLDGLMQGPVDRAQYKEPDEVAEAFLHALTDDHPQLHYMVVPNEQEARMTIKAALRRVAQLNGAQPYTYSREQLSELLDEVLAE
jgi:NAD(P)-dependent dehydrogenase (short-subunit alcohol dehydrogenase family)